MTERSILITGAAGALGLGVIPRVLAEGHATVAVDLGPLDPEQVLPRDFDGRERLHTMQGNALAPEFMESAVAACQSRFGRLDALLHLAGTYQYASLSDTDADTWRRMVDANLNSAYVAAQAALPALRASRGLMVFMGAQAAMSAPANQSAYNASKAGLITFARSMSQELRPDGVRVNCLVPDIIDTPANRRSMPHSDTSHWLTPDQVADVLLYLLSDAASGVTGAAIALQRS